MVWCTFRLFFIDRDGSKDAYLMNRSFSIDNLGCVRSSVQYYLSESYPFIPFFVTYVEFVADVLYLIVHTCHHHLHVFCETKASRPLVKRKRVVWLINGKPSENRYMKGQTHSGTPYTQGQAHSRRLKYTTNAYHTYTDWQEPLSAELADLPPLSKRWIHENYRRSSHNSFAEIKGMQSTGHAPFASPNMLTTNIEDNFVAHTTRSRSPQSCENLRAAPTSSASLQHAQSANTTFRVLRSDIPLVSLKLQCRTTQLPAAHAAKSDLLQTTTATAPSGPPPRLIVQSSNLEHVWPS